MRKTELLPSGERKRDELNFNVIPRWPEHFRQEKAERYHRDGRVMKESREVGLTKSMERLSSLLSREAFDEGGMALVWCASVAKKR